MSYPEQVVKTKIGFDQQIVAATVACLAVDLRVLLVQEDVDPRALTRIIFRISQSDGHGFAKPLLPQLVPLWKHKKIELSQQQAATVLVLDHTFEQIKQFNLFPPSLNQWFGWLKSSVYTVALFSHDFFTLEAQPMRGLLRQIRQGSGFALADELVFKKAKDDIQKRLRGLNSTQGQDVAPILELASHIDKLVRKHSRVVDNLSKRVVDVEQGLFNATHAKLKVMDRLNTLAAQKRIPMAFDRFIRTTWLDSLVITSLRDGIDTEEWSAKDWFSQSLVSVFSYEVDTPQKAQEILSAAESLLAELPEHLVSLEHQPEAKELVIQELRNCIDEIQHGDQEARVEFVSFPKDGLITLPADQMASVRELFKVGQCFEYADSMHRHLCKVAAVLGDYQSILLVNFSGQRLLTVDASEGYFLYQSHRLIAMEQTPIFDHALDHVLSQLGRVASEVPSKDLDELFDRDPIQEKQGFPSASERLHTRLEVEKEQAAEAKKLKGAAVVGDVDLPQCLVEEVKSEEFNQRLKYHKEEIDIDSLPADQITQPLMKGDLIRYIESEQSVKLRVGSVSDDREGILLVDDYGREYLKLSRAVLNAALKDGTIKRIENACTPKKH